MEEISKLNKECVEAIKKAIVAFNKDLSTLRTGRANPQILDRILVDYYGAPTKLNALGTISIPHPRRIEISIYDKTMLTPIEKAIIAANIGISPVVDGLIIKLNFPEITEELRKTLVKQAQQFAEKYRVAIRNNRRDFLKELDNAKKQGMFSEDDYNLQSKQFEQVVKDHIDEIDNILKTKSAEILKV